MGSNGVSEKIAQVLSVIVEAENIQKEFSLKSPYPNPFNPSTMIEYSLPHDTQAILIIYNVSGQAVSVLKYVLINILVNIKLCFWKQVNWKVSVLMSNLAYFR